VNVLRRCIDEAVTTLGQSPSGYDLSALTKAFETDDWRTLKAESGGQHDVAGIMEYIKSSGKPLLVDKTEAAKGSFLLDTGIAARLRDFRRFCITGAVPEIAGALLDSEKVSFFGDQIFVKEPQTRERTAFHQDATYFEIDGEQCCVMWIPVDPVTLEGGVMQYVRGSHRDGKLYQPNVFVSQTPLPGAQGEPLPDIEGHMADYDIVHFDVEPGDVIVHHYRTIHGAGGNHSRYQVRRAASLRYCGDDIRFRTRPWAPHQLHHTHQLSDGDPLGGPDFPVVWRRRHAREAA
jgi:ectoine hydroxylase-related dioxygenase (phytanoyl-CoA dioxygenase family)